ncbi:penicillin-binding transpeptidase domain-containing protein [Candidatus Poriferisodalis sp.]|uniref:penicillin-binding transpeptidase domain-containing protein n=1 Tax=Candidatus Poriferisodalis sp. TaxID=3101277 RepID=UPI003B021135
MSRRIARLAVVLGAGFIVLLVQLSNIGYFSAESLRQHDFNRRAAAAALGQARGAITSADGETIAPAIDPDALGARRLRTYPHGPLYAHVAGYLAPEAGADGLERSYDAELSGRAADIALRDVSDLFADSDRIGDLGLTVHHGVQLTVRAALGDRDGAVVVVHPQTGAILALWSRPSFDPNIVDGLMPDGPALATGLPDARAYQRSYVLTADAASGASGETLLQRASTQPAATGIDLPGEPDAIAQLDGVTLTPLQLALAAAAVANEGVRMRPHVVHQIKARAPGAGTGDAAASADVVQEVAASSIDSLFEPDEAASLLQAMTSAAEQVPIRLVLTDGVEVAAAVAGGAAGSVGDLGGPAGSWAVLLAPADGPTVSVAVLIEPDAALDVGDPQGSGTLATMIAATAAEAALALRAVPTPVGDGP